MKFGKGASGFLKLKQGEFLDGFIVGGLSGARKPEGEPIFNGYRLSNETGRITQGDWIAVEVTQPKLIGEIPAGAQTDRGAIVYVLRVGSSYYLSDQSIGLIDSLPHNRKKVFGK